MIVAVLLLAAFLAELLLSVNGKSQTFDESAHLYSGYVYWKKHDFGVNPEHPPLVKLVAALPLLPLHLPVSEPPKIFFRGASSAGGNQFLYSHDADALLSRGRIAVSVFAFALALSVFFAADEMFGRGAALISLAILIFEPVILANGALVTTDTAVTAALFATVYLFYRYVKRPSAWRLIACGLVTGLALSAKHSALVIFPLLIILAAVELALRRFGSRGMEGETQAARPRAVSMVGALACIAAISIAVLWAFYGFRYSARPGNESMIPPTAAYLQSLSQDRPAADARPLDHPLQEAVIGFFEHHHLLPEAYLYGLTDIAVQTQVGRPAFLFGKLYPNGRWFYFPAAFVIKTSIALMLFLVLLAWAKELRAPGRRPEVLFMAIPAAIYFAIAMGSKLDIGIRHILPIYPFLIVLAGAGAWMLIRQSRRWVYVVAVILGFGAIASARTFPNYLPYSNEMWGGVSHTHLLLSDSNVGWSSGLKSVETYIIKHHITQCWFAYDGPVAPAYYHIPCKALPTLFSSLIRPQLQKPVPEEIEGPVLIASEALTGFDFGPGEMNAYQQFESLRPDAILEGEILVYDGTFQVRKVAALSHFVVAESLIQAGRSTEAMSEAKAAEVLDPDFRPTHEMLSELLLKTKSNR